HHVSSQLEMTQVGIRRSFQERPMSTSTLLTKWLLSGVLGLPCVIVPFGAASPTGHQSRGRDQLWPYHCALIRLINSRAQSIHDTVHEPFRRLVALLRCRALLLGWREFLDSFAWTLASDVLLELRRTSHRPGEVERLRLSLGSAMGRCVYYVL